MDWTGYGDSTRTGDNKYVLASFRGDANLGWVVDLRSFLDIPELKYGDYLRRKHHVASNSRVQSNLNHGLSDAELTIIDVRRYITFAYVDLIDRGATPGGDFDMGTLHEMAADDVLRHTPFNLQIDDSLAGLSSSVRWLGRGSSSDQLEELSDFDPKEIRRRAGGKLRDVQVLAARANSILSPTEFLELRMLVAEPHLKHQFQPNLERIKKLAHVFDVEHAKSVPLLNGLVAQLAEVSGIPRRVASELAMNSPIKEAPSDASDHIQAADFAAGWAADLLVATDNDYRVLAQKVRWITVNGVSIPP